MKNSAAGEKWTEKKIPGSSVSDCEQSYFCKNEMYVSEDYPSDQKSK